MLNYFIRRFLLVIPTFLVATMVVFAVLQYTPGGPFEQIELQMKQRIMSGEASGGGGGGNHNLEVGQARLQCADQLGAKIDLPHTDGVHPKHVPVGDGLLEFGVVPAQPLDKTRPPVAPPSHSPEVIWRGQHEADQK